MRFAKNYLNYIVVIALAVICILLSVTGIASRNMLSLFEKITIAAILAVSL